MSPQIIKRLACAGIGLLVLAVLFPILQDAQLDSVGIVPKKIEIKRSSIVGYQEGRLSWRIKADYVWAGRSQYLFRADRIQDGQLYDANGQIVMDHLEAERVRVNTKSKALSAFDNIRAEFIRRVKRSSGVIYAEESNKNVTIQADELRYFSNNKRTYLYKNIQIIRDDTIIYPNDGVEVDNDKNVAYIEKGFVMVSDEFEVSANNMVIYIDDDYAEINGNVIAKRLSQAEVSSDIDSREKQLRQKEAVLVCDQMVYRGQGDDIQIEVIGNVIVRHHGKVIKGEKGFYDKQVGDYQLEGGVSIEATSLKWMVTKKPESFQNESMKESLEMAVTVQANQLQFDSNKKTLTLIGDVKLTQTDKVVTCEKIVFEDGAGWLNLIGNVEMIKDGHDKIKCQHLKLNVDNETFIANQGVRTEFQVKKNQ